MLNGAKVTKELLNALDSTKKPQTNADRIRAMSDEELEWAIDPAIVPPGMSKREWLKQPAE